MAFYPAGEGTQAAQDEPGIERTGSTTEAPAGPAGSLRKVVDPGEDQGAAQHVAVAAQVLGGGVQNDVGTEGERPLQGGSREGAVDEEAGTGGVNSVGEPGEIENLELRVGRRFGPDERRAGGQGGADRALVGEVREDRLHPPARQEVERQLANAGVEVGVEEDACADGKRLQKRRCSGHAGGEGERRGAAIERRQRFFEAVLGGIAFALVEPAVERLGLGPVEESRGEVNRRNDRAGLPVGLSAGVHGESLEAHSGSLSPASCAASGVGRWAGWPAVEKRARCPSPLRRACRTARAAACRTAPSPRACAAR